MTRSIILSVLLVAFPCMALALQADSICIAGRVLCAPGLPMEACFISVLHPDDSTMVTYGMTDQDGYYSLKFMTDDDEILVRLTGFNVKREIRRVKSVSQILNYSAEEESITLREVQIEAKKLWGSSDTLNYLVSAYMTEYDRTIGDVLKQLPGITIDGKTIKYQGTPINHFYIENMDVLQGRYNIATDGLKAEDVATVQVLENHEHMKVLQDQVPPGSAAINLKLKEKAKGVWTKSVGIGLGRDDGTLWNSEANLMRFSKQHQHVLYYGNDNTGVGADRSYQHYGDDDIEPAVLTDVLHPGTSPVGAALFNNEHAFYTSSAVKLNETAQFNYSVAYNHDIQRRTSYMQTTYLMPDNDMRFLSEDISSRSTTNNAEVQVSYENNAERNFLCQALSMSGKWNEANGTAVSNSGKIRQHAYSRNLGLSGNTHVVHRTADGAGFEVTSRNTVQSTPQALSVGGDMDAHQEAVVTRISTLNKFSLIKDLRHHRWSIVPTAALNVNYVGLESMLRSSVPDSGNMKYLYSEASVGTIMRYVKDEFRLTFRFPLVLSHTDLKKETSTTQVRCSPSLSLLWKASDNWTFSLDGNYGMHQTPWRQLVTSYIMGNYRTTSRYVANLSDSHSTVMAAKVNFKDIMKGFFAYLHGAVSRSWSDVIYGTMIDEDAHTVMQAENVPHHDDTYSLTGNVSKGFDWKKTKIEMNANYTRNKGVALRQSVTTAYHSNTINVHGNLSASIIQALRIGYECSYMVSTSVSNDCSHTIRTLGQHANLSLSLIPNRLLANMTARHTHNSGLQGKRDYAFMDASLTYRTKKKQDFILEACNIFNTRTFVSCSDTELNRLLELYHLRPLSIMLTVRLNL